MNEVLEKPAEKQSKALSARRALLVYYSLEGNTKEIAKKAAAGLKCDLLEIKPVKEIPTKGLMKYLHGGGQVTTKTKPAIKPFTAHLEGYTSIYIAAPVWAGKMASVMDSFLESYPIAGKVKGAIFTSKSGNAKGAVKQIEEITGHPVICASLYDLSMKKAKDNEGLLTAWMRKILHEQRTS